jgi:tetratricopeptide (TPR) repeat protein
MLPLFRKNLTMTTTTLSLLDQAELLQLAANASAGDDAGAALAYLKEAASRPDASGVVHYMLGAEYAQNKMYDRAVGEMEAALALDPALAIARLQLGMLWLTGGVGDKAATVLGPLDELGAGDPLRAFGAGLCHLIADRFTQAVDELARGIALNETNLPLNADMQRLIDEIGKVSGATPAAATEDSQHVLLSAYTGNTSH